MAKQAKRHMDLQVQGSSTVSGNVNVQQDVIVRQRNYSHALAQYYWIPMYTYYNGSQYLNTGFRLGNFTSTADARILVEIDRHGDLNYGLNMRAKYLMEFHIWGGSSGSVNVSCVNLTGVNIGGSWGIDAQKNIYYHDGVLWSQYGVMKVLFSSDFNVNITDVPYPSSGITWRTIGGTTYDFEG